MKAKVTKRFYTNNIINATNSRKPVFLRLMLDEVHRQARPFTPKKRGNLSKDVLKLIEGDVGTIIWDKVYASYQDRGARRDGSHRVKNYTTGGTGKGFAEKGVKGAMKQADGIAGKVLSL